MDRRLYRTVFLNLFLGTILAVCCVGCVSINKENAEDKKMAEILNAQKALIVSLLNKGMAPLALKDLRKNIKENPKDPDFKNLMGLTQLALGNPKQAIPHFSAAYQIEKKIPFGLNLSSALIETGKYQEAIKILLIIKTGPEAESYPYPERIDHNIGLAYEKINKLNLAQKFYTEALSLNPNFYYSILKSAQIHQKLNQPSEAKEMYSKANQACPVCFEPVDSLVATYLTNGDIGNATTLLNNYLKQHNLSATDREKAKQSLKTAAIVKPKKAAPR